MKKIAKLLKADFNESSDLASIAAMLAGKGRGNDTLLAHITPKEAEILKAAGGSGTTNPETGLLEFYDDFEAMPSSQAEFAQYQQAAEPAPVYDYGNVRAEAPIQAPAQTAPTTPSAGLNFPLEVPGQQYSPTIVERPDNLQESLRQQYAPQVARTDVVSRFDQPVEKSFFDKLSSQDMVRLGLAGGLGLYGASQAKKAAGQAQAASAEQKALAQPYQQKGQELIRAAESGELTPTGQQSLQATQARIAQGVEARGGVGAQQAAAQVEAFRQQLLQQQYSYGLQVAQVGDSIAIGAIKSALQADNAVQQATGQFYTNLAAVASGLPLARTTA